MWALKVLSDCPNVIHMTSGEDLPVDGHGRARPDGNGHSRLGHDHHESHRLEGHRLAAGVRAGDHQQIEVVTQAHVDGHHFPRAVGVFDGEQVQQNRVSGLVQVQDAVVAHLGADALVVPAVSVLGGDQVEHAQCGEGPADLGRVLVHQPGKGLEDAVDLLLLFLFEADDAVVQFDGLGRLDVERRSAV